MRWSSGSTADIPVAAIAGANESLSARARRHPPLRRDSVIWHRGHFYLAGVGKHLLLLFQRRLFSDLQMGFAQLVVLEAEIIFFPAFLFILPPQTHEFLVQRTITPVLVAILRERRLIVGPDVNHAQLEPIIAQKQVLMLRVNIDELLTQLFEQRQRDGCVIDKGTALALRRQFPPQETMTRGVVVEVVFFKKSGHRIRRDVKRSLNHGLLRDIFHGPYCRPAAPRISDNAP